MKKLPPDSGRPETGQAGKKPGESERRYRAIFENMAAACCVDEVIHREGRPVDYRILEVNPAYERITGIPREKATGALASELYGTGKVPFLEVFRRVAETGEPAAFEAYFSPIGKHLSFNVSCPAPGMFSTVFSDITARLAAEEELHRKEGLLESAGRIARFGGWSVDLPAGRVIWSDQVAAIHGMPPGYSPSLEEGIDFYAPEWKEKIARVFGQCAREGRPYDEEMEIVTGRGDRVWVRTTGEAVRDGNGEIVRVEGAFQDITAWKRAEEALRASEEFSRTVMDHLPIGVAVNSVDPEVNFTYMNDNFPAIYRTTREALAAGSFWDVVYEDPVFREQLKKRVVEDCLSGDPERMQWDDIPFTRDGETYYICARNIPVPGRPLMISTVWDVTERKRAEAEREGLQTQLAQSQKLESVGRLAGGVAHDFNNMLNVILGRAELALRALGSDHQVARDLKEIVSAGRSSADLTRQLLAFARKQTASPRVLNLNETVGKMLKMLGRLIGEGIELEWTPGDDLWPVRIDPAQVDQVLANLAVNARDAVAGEGRVDIAAINLTLDESSAAAHPGCRPGDYVMLLVRDDGCGMDGETQAQIFEPFFTTKEKGKGTGLGLPMVWGIVEQNGGFVEVESRPGVGTTFRICLPRYRGKSEQALESAPAPPSLRGRETILVVEDDPSNLRLTTRILKSQGYEVLDAATPGEAIARAREYPGTIDLLLTDVVMPEMNGRDLAKNLLFLYPEMKRLFMSGYTADVIAHHGVIEGGVHFIQKPFSVDKLLARIREVLDARS